MSDVNRERIVGFAREWIGTPYHHQASLKGTGCDCLGLVRGIYRELGGSEPGTLPPYSRDWAETAAADEPLLQLARGLLVEVKRGSARPGDVLLFRFCAEAAVKHTAILATPETMIHAREHATVAEVPFSGWWRRRVATVLSFPQS